MSGFEESRQVWRQELAVWSILWICRNILPIAFDERCRDAYSGIRDPDEFMTDFERHLQHLDSSDRSNIQRLLANRLKALSSGRKQTYTLEKRLRELSESHKSSLAAIPSSLDKAKGSLMALIDIGDFESDQEYDAMCLLREHVAPEDIARVVTRWKGELRCSLEEQAKPITALKPDNDLEGDSAPKEKQESIPSFLPKSDIFWISRDLMETLDAMSRYRFIEVFNIGEFPETVAEIEGMFASAVVEFDPAWIASVCGDSKWQSVAHDLWLASRSAMLCGRIRCFIEISITHIANHQHIEGWWPSYVTERVDEYRMRYLPSNYTTALSCVDLLRLSRRNWQLKRARSGVQWLAKQQQPSGSWTRDIARNQKPIQEPDLFTTLLAAEAIRASGLHGYDHTLSMADSWIMSQQDPDGTWKDEIFPFPLMTVLVVEYFERRRPPPSNLGNYLSIARDFILHSRELALEDNENSRRLAIVVAFQGIEAFLYACLSHPSVNIKVFEKSSRTIGMRKALDELEKYLQKTDVLKQGQSIEYRNSLDKLTYYRNEIVHKGASIGEKEAREHTEASARFSELICQRIFGYSLL
ncbi:MAG: hypothetical protein C5S48_02095 [Candidatus Methanogaster sp.]|nr:MAG: hypothetical protein C5S48_02095 [ANME-2 cluster archaeon]